jgi:non-canonical (house-cleaning) NTP pyrophosphatase
MKTYKVIVGSLNPGKIKAVHDFLIQDRRTRPAGLISSVEGFAVDSEVSKQPKSLREMTIGAINRANNARFFTSEGNICIGIESGIYTIRQVGGEDLIFDSTCCAVSVPYRPAVYLGYSSAWQVPRDIAAMILNEGLEMDEAFVACGYTKDPHIGRTVGAIGLVSDGRETREQYTQAALAAALLSWKGLE